ncbi:MAG: hypothetical protein NT051_03355 [Candidatus Micrarchaeota archaeon]|nr:hypothetical protein [Candidatus Micrarchaeota archaeon]
MFALSTRINGKNIQKGVHMDMRIVGENNNSKTVILLGDKPLARILAIVAKRNNEKPPPLANEKAALEDGMLAITGGSGKAVVVTVNAENAKQERSTKEEINLAIKMALLSNGHSC